MSYIIYYNKNEKQNVKNIYWSKDDAYEEVKLQDVCTEYKKDTGLKFDTLEAANKKTDELNSEEAKKPFEKEGDIIICYYAEEEK